MSQIVDSQYQTRLIRDDEDLQQLVESIRNQGILQPICVCGGGNKYTVMAGHRRFAAAKIIGLDTITCSVLDNNKHDPWAVAFHENVYRKDMTPIEEAIFVVESMEKGAMTAEELAPLIRKSVSWIREKITMTAWPDDVAAAVHIGKISVAAAKNLAQIDDDKARIILVEYAVENGANARTTAAWLQGYRANESMENPGEIEPLPGQPITAGVAPYAPCVVCDEKFMMTEMTYLPICATCQEEVIKKIRNELRKN